MGNAPVCSLSGVVSILGYVGDGGVFSGAPLLLFSSKNTTTPTRMTPIGARFRKMFHMSALFLFAIYSFHDRAWMLVPKGDVPFESHEISV
jgi:hypothetical protein